MRNNIRQYGATPLAPSAQPRHSERMTNSDQENVDARFIAEIEALIAEARSAPSNGSDIAELIDAALKEEQEGLAERRRGCKVDGHS